MSANTTIINLGPQHPSTHGVLRVILELEGEIVVRATPDIGFLHRGIEKLSEHRTYHQIIVLTDRLDYLAAMSNNLAYVLTVEKLLNIEIPKRAQYVRVILVELQRIASHLFWLGTHAHDLGAMTPLFYCLREREQILDIFDGIAGSRLTPSFMRIGGLAADIDGSFINLVRHFTSDFSDRVDQYETLLTESPIWQARTKGIGTIPRNEYINLGISGPLARAAGINWDIRKSNPYSSYADFDFAVPQGENGDVFDRYLVRIREMRESTKIINQAIAGLPEGKFAYFESPAVFSSKANVQKNIVSMIHHFNLVMDGIRPPAGEVYQSIESPRGELGFYIISNGSPQPLRLKVRPPSFVNLQGLSRMVQGRMLSDAVGIIGSIDIVLAEVDR
ncbi:MAG: NADH-quinone oxidoreductase subunit D [Deltaproteobacteria bacterium HGW-Deltaproteobacteria-10]|nr:MAG: NADH-quinone oxidoreductase subunit D [Deltaproteobacteria bacterium HGW-Deltaproteobacteria-10]